MVRERVEQDWVPLPVRVINATGVVLHTNIGRAPLSAAATLAVERASAYSDLELDLATGERDERMRRVASMLTALTGAEAATVTGNNAGAMLLCLSALAAGREVIVSRGQEVEIGGSFRVPDILGQSGARLVEVGTTNRTRLEDYKAAIGPDTAAILHVHPSNFRVIGFASSVPLGSLSNLAREHGILLLDDNGSGPLLDTAAYGLDHEPMPQEALVAGADLVTFSGDKLLGGPQAGIILGRSHLVDRIAASPLARAVRPDKLALAALAATLDAYLRGVAAQTVPVWQMIGQNSEVILARSKRWRRRSARRGIPVDLVAGESTIGGGSLPGSAMRTTLIVLPASITAARLRTGSPPVLSITRDGRTLLDLRTVRGEDEGPLLEAVVAASA
jgi:L-seryl-tRNA(Ser) seleniumtransferase